MPRTSDDEVRQQREAAREELSRIRSENQRKDDRTWEQDKD